MCNWEDSNRAAARSAASKATVRLCLARGSQPVGMSNKRPAVHPGEMELPKNPQYTFVCRGFFLCNREDSNKAAARSAASKATVRLCLARGSQPVGMSNKRLRFTVRREDSSYPFLFFIQMRYSPSVMRVSRYRMGVRQASRMEAGRLPVA